MVRKKAKLAAEPRGSARLRKREEERSRQQRTLLHKLAERKRLRLERLQNDNYGVKDPTPHAAAEANPLQKKAEAAGGSASRSGRKRKKRHAQRSLRDTATFQQMLSLSHAPPGVPSYVGASATPSEQPPLPLCATCGHIAPYTCPHCLSRFCSVKCRKAHVDLGAAGCGDASK